MPTVLPLALDLAAVGILCAGLYLPRHGRRELVVAYLAVNVGVLAVATALAGTAVPAGLGLGLFGVLSIIRLRSTQLDQHEVAYYFSALALGLLCGLGATPLWMTAVLCALVLLALHVGDHPRLLPRRRNHLMTLDSAHTDESALIAHLERLLGVEVLAVSLQKVDLVMQTTLVEVRYDAPRPALARTEPGLSVRSAAIR
ncbi:MAG TPA: DUF4956 domain-containing protein [Actinotalea sp.]|jgi:MFS family permease